MMWRIRICILGVAIFVVVLAALPHNNEGAAAAPLLQIPPTSPINTPIPPTIAPTLSPTDTPIPTSPPQPSATPIGPTPSGNTPTPIPPTRTPRPGGGGGGGGGGGAPPGPSNPPVVGGCVKSVGRNGISLSTAPGFYQPHVQVILRDHLAQVLAGPARADNIWWWRLRAETGAEGWGNQDDMTPDPGPCAFGGVVVSGAQAPPYPVTILPASSFAQTPVAPPTLQATPTQQGTLPQTGDSVGWWFLAGLLAVTMMVVGYARRRLQTQPAVRSESREEEETDIKNH